MDLFANAVGRLDCIRFNVYYSRVDDIAYLSHFSFSYHTIRQFFYPSIPEQRVTRPPFACASLFWIARNWPYFSF
jgi:hypothetical protein